MNKLINNKAKLLKQKVYFCSHLPSDLQLKKSCSIKPFKSYPPQMLFICDKKLKSLFFSKRTKSYFKKPLVFFVKAGEDLKDFKFFYPYVKKILKLVKNQNIKAFVSVGGGSVGDFTGFLASIWQRGVKLIHIPTTALAMLDSAHGGKTAVNVEGVKNFIGTYHFPSSVFIVKNCLLSLNKKELLSAKAELLKIALIYGKQFYQKFISSPPTTYQQLWSFLPMAILIKLQVVKKDPFGKKAIRQKLNLGHSIGHVLETYFNLPHGQAVNYGLGFTMWWSYKKHYITKAFYQQLSPFLNYKKSAFLLKTLPQKKLKYLLLKDKKIIDSKYINFVFVKKPGQVFVKKTLLNQLLKAVKQFANFK